MLFVIPVLSAPASSSSPPPFPCAVLFVFLFSRSRHESRHVLLHYHRRNRLLYNGHDDALIHLLLYLSEIAGSCDLV